jgi:hypothetical protein
MEDPGSRPAVKSATAEGKHVRGLPTTPVERYRYAEFTRLGFAPVDARTMAMSDGRDVDIELVRRLVRSGCPLELIVKIVC